MGPISHGVMTPWWRVAPPGYTFRREDYSGGDPDGLDAQRPGEERSGSHGERI